MEKQGIITGIGNEITPEIDAVINEYIVGKNTILKGLELNGNILSAGTCILCGYRGTLENSQPVAGNYVYGKFVIGVNETDSFSIITSSNSAEPTDGIINPTSITSAGTYYLRLYANGASQVDSERYPKQAYISERARHLIAGGIIYSTATTDTAPVNDNSKRVANTEYVQKQIVEELGYEKQVVDISMNGVGYNLTFEKRARYCLISYNISAQRGQPPKTEFKVPRGFEPANNSETIIFIKGYTNVQYVYKLYVTTAGVASIVLVGSITMETPSMGTLYAGYKI